MKTARDILEKEVEANENSPRHIRKGGASERSDFNQREKIVDVNGLLATQSLNLFCSIQ